MEHLTQCDWFSLFFGAFVGGILGSFLSARILYRAFQDEIRKHGGIKSKESK